VFGWFLGNFGMMFTRANQGKEINHPSTITEETFLYACDRIGLQPFSNLGMSAPFAPYVQKHISQKGSQGNLRKGTLSKKLRDESTVLDLSEVNSRIASKILFLNQKAVAKYPVAEMGRMKFGMRSQTLKLPQKSVSKYERTGQQIADYESAVNSTLKDLRKKTILDLTVTGTTVVILVAAVIWSNLSGVLAAVGLGGTNAYAQGKAWQSTVAVYWNDSGTLKQNVDYLKKKYHECASNDDSCLDKVSAMIDESFKGLRKASTPEK